MKRRLVSLILVLVLAACVLPAQAASGTLRRGSRGTAVTQLQTALKELGLYTIKVDGIYGRGTVAAVKSYQRKNGLVAGFKYFDLTGAERITLRLRGTARGQLFIRTDPRGEALGTIAVHPSKEWTSYTVPLIPCTGTRALYLCYEGRGKLDILDFSF